MKMIEKVLYLGLGMFSVTRDRIEKIVDELMEKGEISLEEAGEVVENLIKRGEEERKAIRKLVQEEMGGWKKDFSTSTQSELEELKARISELEKRFEQS
jgi:polyhydroxyalkanoate synthesis regulator phasin